MTSQPDELLPWQWPEEVWRGKVEQVRAGRNLKPARWKNGARCGEGNAPVKSFRCHCGGIM